MEDKYAADAEIIGRYTSWRFLIQVSQHVRKSGHAVVAEGSTGLRNVINRMKQYPEWSWRVLGEGGGLEDVTVEKVEEILAVYIRAHGDTDKPTYRNRLSSARVVE